jgi:two-component system cell cycle sensor histidine kinase/response regulator CckA
MGFATENRLSRAPASTGAREKIKPPKYESQLPQVEDAAGGQESARPAQSYSEIIARATNDAVRDLDLDTNQLSWPLGLDSLLGFDAETTAIDSSFWHDRLHPEDRTRVVASLRNSIASEDERWSAEYRFRRADGEYLHLLERAFIIRDESGFAKRLVGLLMDMTARHQSEEQLCRSQKMEAFGQLAAGAAHDFNNFLTTIIGYSDLILTEIGSKSRLGSHINEIRKAAGRASNLTAQLLAFSRKQTLEPHVLEVNALIQNLEQSVLRLLGANISVDCHLHDTKDAGHIRVDPDKLTQIVLNLAVNARDAMPDGGDLRLETAIVTLPSQRQFEDWQLLPDREPLSAGDYVVITVADNGTGMDEEVKAHLFEPFFTTKAQDGATGLGLATSYGIVRQSGGRIIVESELGRGTKVEIFLPRVSPPAYRKPSSRKLPTGTETVLVLEDDVSVRHLSVRVLRSLGYRVIEAASGDDAQRLIRSHGDQEIHLLLTDVVMPQMSGRHFADWLRKESPLTKLVFVSGYLDESHTDDGMFFLPKPFDSEQLAQTIRQAIDS